MRIMGALHHSHFAEFTSSVLVPSFCIVSCARLSLLYLCRRTNIADPWLFCIGDLTQEENTRSTREGEHG